MTLTPTQMATQQRSVSFRPPPEPCLVLHEGRGLILHQSCRRCRGQAVALAGAGSILFWLWCATSSAIVAASKLRWHARAPTRSRPLRSGTGMAGTEPTVKLPISSGREAVPLFEDGRADDGVAVVFASLT